MRSKTVRSPETETQSQLSAFAVTSATTPQRSNPFNDASANAEHRQHANFPTLVHADADGQSTAAESRRAT